MRPFSLHLYNFFRRFFLSLSFFLHFVYYDDNSRHGALMTSIWSIRGKVSFSKIVRPKWMEGLKRKRGENESGVERGTVSSTFPQSPRRLHRFNLPSTLCLLAVNVFYREFLLPHPLILFPTFPLFLFHDSSICLQSFCKLNNLAQRLTTICNWYYTICRLPWLLIWVLQMS